MTHESQAVLSTPSGEQGTHTGEAMGIPPSNQAISVRGMELWRVENGKVVEHWGVVDISDVLAKAGLIPPP